MEWTHALAGVGSGVFWIIMGALLIPISAIVLGIFSSVVKTVVKSQERRYQIKLEAQNAAIGISDNVAEALRQEIAKLRDTSTEHSMSIQHSLERLEHRVTYLEQKVCDSAEYGSRATQAAAEYDSRTAAEYETAPPRTVQQRLGH